MAGDEIRQTEQAVPENYENFLEDYTHFAPPAADEVLQGTVLAMTAKDVIIDFGYKSEGLVPIEQFHNHKGEVTVQAGDVVDVMIDHAASSRKATSCSRHTQRRAAAHLGQPGEGATANNW